MHSTHLRRTAAVVGAATAIAVTTTLTAATGAVATDAPDGDRPCFMVRAHWNAALDGPQPTCATPSWQLVETPPRFPASELSARVVDYMP